LNFLEKARFPPGFFVALPWQSIYPEASLNWPKKESLMPQSDVLDQMLHVTLPDGNVKTLTTGSTGHDVAASIGPRLAEVALAIKVNGVVQDLYEPLTGDAKVEIITMKSAEALELIRHDAAHIMAEAVQTLFPGTQVTIGPAIEDGFYYDFARAEPFTPDDFEKIEAKMREIVAAKRPFKRTVVPRADAIKTFEAKGEAFKVELIQDLPSDAPISLYSQGEWFDLCRGPHMPTTGHTGNAFKIMKVAGAYWRGDSNRPMLQRIYATAWRDKKELDAYLLRLEEAEKRDHRKLGKQMELFHLQDEAQGSVFWHPKGYAIWLALEGYMRKRLNEADYVEVKTPQLMDSRFWEASGHWGKYRENMFVVPDVVPNTEEGEKVFKEDPKHFMALKPMNCPAHVQIFKQGIKSYRDLPIRMAEFGCCHRNEAHGALHGLMRVRQFTQDDAHIFCSEDQILEESIRFCKLTERVYKDLGFDSYTIKLETRPENRVGSDELWDKAENGLMQALKELGMEYEISPGDGAFYGPKLAFVVRDAIGREWGCATLQLDFNLPERLDASYIGEDGGRHRPVMLHRAILGSIERFIGILIENYAGALPVWLAPIQAVVANIITDDTAYASKVIDALKAKGVRVEADFRPEKINYKVREHSLQKIPYIIAVGAREAEENTVSVRTFGSDKQSVMTLDEFLAKIETEAKAP
jgi:threonyl-tRNA synthetase